MTEATRLRTATTSAPDLRLRQGRYEIRFAREASELDEILQLRFKVFNLELGEGLQISFATGRDQDAFDLACHHLLVEDKASGRIVGTYRMQTSEMAGAAGGFYSAGEFALETMPAHVLDSAVEVGRACIDREHRSRQVLFLLWKGLAAYVVHFGKRYLFGCCSLSSQDSAAGLALHRELVQAGKLHPTLEVLPREGFECRAPAAAPAPDFPPATPVEVPPLFAIYLRYGALVCGPPAIDRGFKTIDYLVLLDVDALEPRAFRAFFHGEKGA
jgi:putative hemolysin